MDYTPLLGVEPGEIARPNTVEEITALVAQANAAGKAVIPWGGGTGQDYGYLPQRADIVLDLGNLNRILAHEPGDLTVTVEAGVTLAQVQKTLAAHNQFLPLDPPHPDRATLGGILAANAAGAARLGYGTARDWLIGLSIVDAQGRLIKGGGKVVKNVTGYDLPKLHIGALGTLGVIVEATFKVAPLPETTRTVGFRFAGGPAGTEFLRRLHTNLAPAFSILDNVSAWDPKARGNEIEREARLYLVFHGTEEVVSDATARVGEIARDCGAPASTHLHSPLTALKTDNAPLVARIAGLPEDSAAQHEALSALSDRAWVRTLPGVGHTQVAFHTSEDPASAINELIEWAHGSKTPIVFARAPLALRRGAPDLWWPLPPGFALMRRMKGTLDPNNTLNPGRFIGRL